jgi:hypothetical protein
VCLPESNKDSLAWMVLHISLYSNLRLVENQIDKEFFSVFAEKLDKKFSKSYPVFT